MLNKNIFTIFGYLFLGALLMSCSKSDDTTEKSISLSTTFNFTGTDNWPERYSITLGVFAKDTINPLVYKAIDNPGENTDISANLNNISSRVTLVKLYIANSAHQPVFTLFRSAINATSQHEITIPQEAIALLTYQRIQSQVFSNCIVCHGGSSGEPAAGLSLMTNVSYNNLVNHISTNSEKNRVKPGDIDNSFIIDVLRKKQSLFVHSASNTIAEEDIELLENWTKADAPNN